MAASVMPLTDSPGSDLARNEPELLLTAASTIADHTVKGANAQLMRSLSVVRYGAGDRRQLALLSLLG
jgi:hypothetical protein